MAVRRANVADAKVIHRLVNDAAKRNKVMPRSLSSIYENIRDFLVFEEAGAVRGACALHVMWDNLAEIRSLTVDAESRRRGIGTALVRRALRDARQIGVKRVFSLTYIPAFFHRLGFADVDKGELPHKIWGDCVHCPQFPDCEELAVIRIL